MAQDRIVIIGAGPAGMACAHTLTAKGRPCTVIEKEDMPGGLCRTLDHGGYLFDIGGHRFLTKSDEIDKLWREVMGDDMLHVKRLSRIYYNKRYFDYPLSFFNTFWNLGPFESALCVASYLKSKISRVDDSTFEGWVINRFGKRLYDIFFKTYTEKVWAVACTDISADWASQRLRGLSLRIAIKKAMLGMKGKSPKTLSGEFLYPRTGPGEFYYRLKERVSEGGGQFIFKRTLTGIRHNANNVSSIEVEDARTGKREEMPVEYLFSSMPLPSMIMALDPAPPDEVLQAARNLRFRDFLVVNLILDKERIFPDQWIYVHSPEVKLGRVQNYKNWSPAMVIDPKKTSLGLEYFCTEGDELWRMNDVDLINYAIRELESIGIVSRRYLVNGFVVRCQNAYPIYSLGYQKNMDIVRGYLSRFTNLQTIGRGGLFRYDNSDHALLTGIYAAKNFLGAGHYDLWKVSAEDGYLES